MSRSSLIFVLFCLASVSFGAPIEDDEENVQLLDSFQSRGDEAFEFKFELSDGQMREETIQYDDLDKGISIRGSYKMELENGEMQTIYYISDVSGHRISIDVPFPETIEKRPPPTRKPQTKKFSFDEVKSFEENRIDDSSRKGKVQEHRPAAPRVSEQIIESTTRAARVTKKVYRTTTTQKATTAEPIREESTEEIVEEPEVAEPVDAEAESDAKPGNDGENTENDDTEEQEEDAE